MNRFWTTSRNLMCVARAGVALSTMPMRAENVTVDYDHTANFSQFHTFSFYKVQSDNPFFEPRVEEAITRDLTKRGLERIASGGDISITAIGETKDVQQYNTFYTGLGGGGFGWGGWGGWGGGRWGSNGLSQATTTVQQVPTGTLLVDLYDSKTHQLVWRGRTHDELSSKPDKNTKKLNKAVDKMFKNFPPKMNS